MLLQTNSYIVPREKRAEHQRLIRRFRQTLKRLGCDHFEVYEQVGPNWSNSESSGRYVQILRFVDRKHQLSVQQAERTDPTAQAVIADFCDLVNFPYQQQQGLFAVGFYTSVLPVAPKRGVGGELISTVEHEIIDEPEVEDAINGHVERLDEPVAEPLADTQLNGLRAAAVERRHEMIDTVVMDSPTTAPGELFDVLEADAPVDGLEGTPPETEFIVEAIADKPRPVVADAHAPFKMEDDDEAHGANGFVLEDVVEAHPAKNRPTW